MPQPSPHARVSSCIFHLENLRGWRFDQGLEPIERDHRDHGQRSVAECLLVSHPQDCNNVTTAAVRC